MEKPESCNRNVGKVSHNRCATSKRKYPPPMPLLARTGNLPGHMYARVLTMHYTNGKLILTEERVKLHDYFETYRENGRLILNLVAVDDKVRCCHSVYKKEEELQLEDVVNVWLIDEEKETKIVANSEEEVEEDGGCYEYDLEEEVVMQENMMTGGWAWSSLPKLCNMNNERRRSGGDVGKCLTLTYAGGMIGHDINLTSWNVNAFRHPNMNARGGYVINQSASADHPLANFSLRPMASVAS